MGVSFVNLPDDILLLVLSHLPWHTLVLLADLHPRLRELGPYAAFTDDEQWRVLLYRANIGLSVEDRQAGRTWCQLARKVCCHATACVVCRELLQDELSSATDPAVLDRTQARQHEGIHILPGLDMDRIYEHNEPGWPMVTVLYASQHEDRARIGLKESLHLLQKDCAASSVENLKEEIRKGVDSAAAQFVTGSRRARLDQHVVTASLFLTNLPVDCFYYDCHDFVYHKSSNSRSEAIWTDSVTMANPTGITVLDGMRAITEWSATGKLEEGELVKFMGFTWDTREFINTPGGSPEVVELIANYGGNDDY